MSQRKSIVEMVSGPCADSLEGPRGWKRPLYGQYNDAQDRRVRYERRTWETQTDERRGAGRYYDGIPPVVVDPGKRPTPEQVALRLGLGVSDVEEIC